MSVLASRLLPQASQPAQTIFDGPEKVPVRGARDLGQAAVGHPTLAPHDLASPAGNRIFRRQPAAPLGRAQGRRPGAWYYRGMSKRLIGINARIALDEPQRWKDLVAHLAFTMDGDLVYAMTRSEMGSPDTTYDIALAVSDAWTDATSEVFRERFERALRYARGMPWLRADEILALLAAEDVAAKYVPGTEDLFAAMKTTRPAGWAPLVEALLVKASDAGLAATATAIVEAAFRGLGAGG